VAEVLESKEGGTGRRETVEAWKAVEDIGWILRVN
jgi:hypothetical protein